MMNKTVIEYVLDRLYQIGIHDILVLLVTMHSLLKMQYVKVKKCAGLATAMNLMPHMLRMATLA